MLITRRAALKGLLATTVGAATGTAAYGIGYERYNVGVTEAELSVAGLPRALHGLRVGFMTDIHHSEYVSADDVAGAVALLQGTNPDLIVLGGDYVTRADRAYVGPVAELLRPLHAPHGVFAILGNHDDDRHMPGALAQNGLEVLKDQRTTLTIRGERIELAGIRFWTRTRADVGRVLGEPQHPTILLAHDPRRLVEASALNVPMVLAGHTHGGQVVIPGVPALVRRRYPVLAGVAKRNDTSIFVSRGIGTVYIPIRINCPPEVAVVTLRG